MLHRRSNAPSFRADNVRAVRTALVAVLIVATLPLIGTVLAYFVAGIPTTTSVGDALAVLRAPFYVGWVSALGVLTGTVGASISLFTATILRRRRGPETRLLGALGTLTALLVLDDQFQLHENVMPRYIGIPEPWPYLIYLAIFIPIALRFWRDAVNHPDGAVLFVALAFFAVSVLLDAVASPREGRQLVEEAAKLYGIACWTLFALRASARALGRGSAP